MTPSSRGFRIGTRGSALALWQADRVETALAAAGYRTERVVIETTGDLVPHLPLAKIGSRALFTKQIDDALLGGRVDLAVHSLKDLATALPEGLTLAAVGRREDSSDALVGRGAVRWADLPTGATVATGSLRRLAQLRHLRPDLRVVDLRGNVDTRLRKLDTTPEWHAIILASAGLIRLGLAHRIGERLAPELMMPAPGQGALAVTARADDAPAIAAARSVVQHEPTATAVAAERGLLRRVEGGCQLPVAALAGMEEGGGFVLRGRVLSLDGRRIAEGRLVESGVEGSAAASALGTRLAEQLLAAGAAEILAEVRAAAAATTTER